jgi:hypothetical protein
MHQNKHTTYKIPTSLFSSSSDWCKGFQASRVWATNAAALVKYLFFSSSA